MKMKALGSLIELPPELQSDILVRLPPTSLLLCKGVCKSLHSLVQTLIQNPDFIQTHLTRINSSPKTLILQLEIQKKLLVYNKERNPNVHTFSLTPFIPPISNEKPHQVFIIGSCNGLILIGVRLGDFFDNEPDYLLILLNPVIGQKIYLPKPRYKRRGHYGFGFVPETNDYVVIKVASMGNIIEVYKMNNNSWITVDYSSRGAYMFDNLLYGNDNLIFLNGSFHWSSSRISDVDIVNYNLKDEDLGVIKAVDYHSIKSATTFDYGEYFTIKKLVVVDKSLAMIYWHSEDIFPLEIWVMNDYGVGDSWTPWFFIDENLYDYHACELVGYWTSGLLIINDTRQGYSRIKIELDKCVSTFILYDVNTGSRMKIATMEKYCHITGFCNFTETLVPVPVTKVD